MMTNYTNLKIEQQGGILIVTINRENKLNALNTETLKELHELFSQALADDSTGGIILTGSGTKAFVAGADIMEFSGYSSVEGRKLAEDGQRNVFDFIQNLDKPVIAAINGFALGGGLELALACHIRIASDNAKMGLPEVTLGLIPGYGGTQRLPQLVGKGKALEMILTADMITADDALQSGLVNYVVPQEELLEKAIGMMSKILSRSPQAVSSAIKAVNSSYNLEENGFETEISEFSRCFDTADHKEGVAAFLEKRKPVFTGK